MANQLGLVHPGLLQSLGATEFYPSLCSIQADGSSRTATGAPDTPAWADVALFTDIPCRMAPAAQTDREMLAQSGIYVESLVIVALAGYYPAIVATQQAVVGDVAYGIMFVRHDGSEQSTYLYLRRVV